MKVSQQRSWTWEGTTPHGGGWTAGKQLGRKRPWWLWSPVKHKPIMWPCDKGKHSNKLHQTVHSSGQWRWSLTLFITSEATTGVQCPVLDSSVQKEPYGYTGQSPVKRHEDDWGIKPSLLWGKTGAFCLGEVLGGSYHRIIKSGRDHTPIMIKTDFFSKCLSWSSKSR